MPLTVHRAERADTLVDELAAVLADPPEDPFETDVVSVPTRGVERWITQRLSHHLGAVDGGGVCAAVAFPPPGALVAQCVQAAGVPMQDDPWRPERLSRVILAWLPEWSARDGFEVLGSYLQGGDPFGGHGRAWAAAELLATLLAEYGAQRPQLLRAWASGDDGGIAADLAWQPRLFRDLTERLGVPAPAVRIPAACAAMRADAGAVDLPQRLSVFGPTRLSADQVAVLSAVAQHRDVHLWLPHPSPALWDSVAAVLASGPTDRWRRREDPTATLPRHPLLASWARDAREMQIALAAATTGSERVDAHHPQPSPTRPAGTLLAALQQKVCADHDPVGAQAHRVGSSDTSVQAHACHGATRQVEVLREVVLHLLSSDPSLQLRDILIMCPDLERFAPLLTAAFNLDHPGSFGADASPGARPGTAAPGQPHPGQRLRVRVADRSARSVNPVLALLTHLLELARARVSAADILDLAATDVVRRRFRFSDDDLDRIRDWSAEVGVRWGLDGDHRGLFGLAGLPHNTWRSGLDRLLLGVVQSEDAGPLGTSLGVSEIDSPDIAVIGRLAELVDRVRLLLHATMSRMSIQGWIDWFATAMDQLALPAPENDWHLGHASRVLASLGTPDAAPPEDAQLGSGPEVLIDLDGARAMVASRFAGRPTRSGFRTGDLTICALAPMRSVPHRVTILLGMDENVFPRRGAHDGESVLAREPCVGERDRGSEDRQLLLDAVMATQDALIIVYSGADEVTGAPRPPAVPVSELADVVNASAVADGYARAWDRVLTRHPLQGFAARNFADAALGVAGPFSHDHVNMAAATSAARRPRGRSRPAPFLAGPLRPPEPEVTVDLVAFTSFLLAPVTGFLRDRLGLVVPRPLSASDTTQVPLELDALQEWSVGDRLLQGALAGQDWQDASARELRRGAVPPHALGQAPMAVAGRRVTAILNEAEPYLRDSAESVSVRVPLGETTLQGTVGGLRGRRLVHAQMSRLGPRHRLQAWVELLSVVACAGPPQVSASVVVARAPGGEGVTTGQLAAPAAEDAAALLATLLRVREAGLAAPLPLPLKPAWSYAQARAGGASVDAALAGADDVYTDDLARGYDPQSSAYRQVWGHLFDRGRVPWRTLLSMQAPLHTRFDEENTVFGALARTIYDPLLQAWSPGGQAR